MSASDEVSLPTHERPASEETNRRPALLAILIALTISSAMCLAAGADALERHLLGAVERRQWSGTIVVVWLLIRAHEGLLRRAWLNAKTYYGLFSILSLSIFVGTAIGVVASSWIHGDGVSGGVVSDGVFFGIWMGLIMGMLLTRSTDDRYGPKPRKGAA